MKVRLTLQEKLRDLRDEKKLTLTALSEATGIPTATLQRLEANDDHHASYRTWRLWRRSMACPPITFSGRRITAITATWK